jgi:hypothetical protein
MKTFFHRSAAIVSLGLLSSGCIVDSLDEELSGAPPLSALDGPSGNTGSNGLPPEPYLLRRYQLDQLMQQALPTNMWLNPLTSAFLSTQEGEQVFGYAVECALSARQTVSTFRGASLMATAGGWVSGGLNQQQRDDVHTCITTRLNRTGVAVPIWIGGPNTVKDTGADSHEYFEAVWSVTVGPTSSVISVWPSSNFQLNPQCQSQTAITEDFQSRVCADDASLCNITPRFDLSTACTGAPGAGNWICDGKPAIETRLNLNEWNAMHLHHCTIP